MSPHLRGHVRAYVDRALPATMLQSFDRHLVCCAMCRALADQERRIVSSLRAETGVPQSLRSALMGLAGSAVDVPPVPRPPLGHRMPLASAPTRVPTVAPTSPALHRSPVRAAVVASIAAGASVAAAWGLAVSPLPAGGIVRVPSAGVPSGVASMAPGGLAPAAAVPARPTGAGLWSVPSRGWTTASWGRSALATTAPVRFGLVNSAESRP